MDIDVKLFWKIEELAKFLNSHAIQPASRVIEKVNNNFKKDIDSLIFSFIMTLFFKFFHIKKPLIKNSIKGFLLKF